MDDHLKPFLGKAARCEGKALLEAAHRSLGAGLGSLTVYVIRAGDLADLGSCSNLQCNLHRHFPVCVCVCVCVTVETRLACAKFARVTHHPP